MDTTLRGAGIPPVDYRSTITPIARPGQLATTVKVNELIPLPPAMPVRTEVCKSFKAFREIVKAQSKDVSPVCYEMPPGAGKSTSVPQAFLELHNDRPVVVVEPTASLAAVLADYKGAVCIDDFSSLTPGLYYTHGTALISAVVSGKITSGIVLLHDECHSVDYASYVLRRIAGRPGAPFYRYVQLTATPAGSPGSTGRAAGAPELRVRIVDVPPLAEWSLHDGKGLFSLATFARSKSTVVVSDDDNMSNALVTELSRNGFSTWMLRRGDSYERVRDCLASLRSSHDQVVGVVDSSYSSGYNIDCDLLIDCGVTRYTAYHDGRVLDDVEKTPPVESRQRRERVARSRPAQVIQPKSVGTGIYVLNRNEADHAKAALALMGFDDRDPAVAGALIPLSIGYEELKKFVSQAFPYMYWLNQIRPESRPTTPVRVADLDSSFFLRSIEPTADGFFSGVGRVPAAADTVSRIAYMPVALAAGSDVSDPALALVNGSDDSGSGFSGPDSEPAAVYDVFYQKIHEDYGTIADATYGLDDFLSTQSGAVVEDRNLRPAGVRVGHEMRTLVDIVQRGNPCPIEFLREDECDYYMSLLVSRWNANAARVVDARAVADHIDECGFSYLEKMHKLNDCVQTVSGSHRANEFLRTLFLSFEQALFKMPVVCPALAKAVATRALNNLPKPRHCSTNVRAQSICAQITAHTISTRNVDADRVQELVPACAVQVGGRDVSMQYSLPKLKQRPPSKEVRVYKDFVVSLLTLLQSGNKTSVSMAEVSLAKCGISVKDFLYENT